MPPMPNYPVPHLGGGGGIASTRNELFVTGRGCVPRPSSFPRGTVVILPLSLGLGARICFGRIVRFRGGGADPPPILEYKNRVFFNEKPVDP